MREKLRFYKEKVLVHWQRKEVRAIAVFLLAIAVPLTVMLAQLQQDGRQRASTPITAPVSSFQTAIRFDGTSNILKYARLRITQPFTVEGWIRPERNPATPSQFSIFQTDPPTYDQGCSNRLLMSGVVFQEGQPQYPGYSVTTDIVSEGQRYGIYDQAYRMKGREFDKAMHVALVVNNLNKAALYLDGMYVGERQFQKPLCIDSTLTFGAEDGENPLYLYTGFVDEWRISSGSKYSSNFTPSSVPFVSTAETLALFHFDGNTRDIGPKNLTAKEIGTFQFIDFRMPVTPTTIISTFPSLTPTAVPTPTEKPTPTFLPTNTPVQIIPPTFTPQPTQVSNKLKASVRAVSIRMRRGETRQAFVLTAARATTFRIDGRPVDSSQNIQWTPRAGSVAGRGVPIKISVGSKVKPGIYRGTGVVVATGIRRSAPLYIPVTVRVEK